MAKKLKPRFDVNAETSDRTGFEGLIETFIRRFRNLTFALFLVILFCMVVSALGISLAPGFVIFHYLLEWTQSWALVWRSIALGMGLAFSYFVYGFCLIFVVPAFNLLVPRMKPWAGPWYSLEVMPWFMHNTLTYMVRFTFLDFITPTPLNILFFRMMGMKIGKGVMINSSYISDPSMITIGDYVTIGGSATIFAHYGQKGLLIIRPVVIHKGATIGLKASIMGDVEVGEGAMVPPHTCLLPKTRFPGKIN
jgi:hypothetical protein